MFDQYELGDRMSETLTIVFVNCDGCSLNDCHYERVELKTSDNNWRVSAIAGRTRCFQISGHQIMN